MHLIDQLRYKRTSKVKVNGYEFTRLLPSPKGSGFPPTTTERILLMNSRYSFSVTGAYSPSFGALDSIYDDMIS